MFKRIAAIALVAIAAAACSLIDTEGDSQALPQHWLEFDPCALVDEELAVSLLGTADIETEAKSLTNLGGDEITKRHCSVEARGFKSVGVQFGLGSKSMADGDGFRSLTDIGDEASMSVFLDGADQDEIISIEVNVEGMWLYVNSTPNLDIAADTPGGLALVALAKTAADRLREAAQAMPE